MGKSHVKKTKNWFKRLFGKRKKSAKNEESGRVPENDVQVAQEPENIPEEVHLEQVCQHNAENMQQIEQLKTQLERNDQQVRQTSDDQKNYENITTNLDAKLHHLEQLLQDNDAKYHEQRKSLLVEIELKDNHHKAVCLEGQVGNVAFPGKIMADSDTQKLEREDFFQRIVEKTEILSQRLSAKDEELKAITLKSNVLLEDVMNVANKLSEMQRQQLKVVESCQQMEVLSQRLSVKEEELKQITSKNKVLSDDLMKVTKKLSEVERQQQEQLQRNEQQQEKVIESCQQIEVLSQRLSVKEELKQITSKNKVLSDDLMKVTKKLSEVERQQQEQLQRNEQQQEKVIESCQQIEVLSQRLSVKEEELKQITSKNKVLSDDLMKVTNKLSEVERQQQEQLQRNEQQQEKVIESCQQIEVLSQRLSVKDEELKQITSKNKVLSDDLMKVTKKLSEVERQQQEQLQRNEQQQEKVIESCQQIEVLSQYLIAKDEEFKQIPSKNKKLSRDLMNLSCEFYASEQQLQRQEQINIDSHKQVALLMADFQSQNECLNAVMLKHNSIIEAMYHICIKVQNLEQQQQQPQQQPCSQLPFEQEKLEKPQTQQTYQNDLQRHQPWKNKEPRVIHHVIECGEELKSSSNAWRPTKKRGMTSDEDVIRQFRCLLNKLTPENFDRIVSQMKCINITKEGHLKDIVQLVRNKAMLESKFSKVYANMCYHLSKVEVHETSKPGNVLDFRTLLIQGCHNELIMGMDGSSSLDDEASEKARRRAIGNVIFIGELFNAEILHESVISDTVRWFLKDGKEHSSECFCRLLGVVGENLDSTHPAMMNEHFTSLVELLKGKKMSSRIRFMLQDLIDLRKRKWTPRLKVEQPMCLQDVREQAEQQQRLR